MYEYYNPNPFQRNTGDCTQRALAKALGIDWDMASVILADKAIKMGYTADDKHVFSAVLKENGFDRFAIPNTCPDCYTADVFCREFFKGTYVLGFGNHVATVIDGVLYDTWDSRNEVPHFYWQKKEAE